MIVTISLSAAVAVLVVFLKPIVENWFETKKRRVTFRVDYPIHKKTPFTPEIKMKWGDHEFDEIFGYECSLNNETGRTLRDVSFILSAFPGAPQNGFCYLTSGTNRIAPNDDGEGHRTWHLNFEELARGQQTALYLLSNEDQTLTLKTSADLEVYTVAAGHRVRNTRIRRISGMIQGGMLAAANAFVLASYLGFIK